MLSMLLITGCASKQTQVVRQIEYVDRYIVVTKNVYLPDDLLIPCNVDNEIMPNDSTWGDLTQKYLVARHERTRCASKLDAIIEWTEKQKEVDSQFDSQL